MSFQYEILVLEKTTIFESAFKIVANLDPKAYDFSKNWTPYWNQRCQVYYQKDLKQIIDKIGSNYKFVPTQTPSADQVSSSCMKMHSSNNSTKHGNQM